MQRARITPLLAVSLIANAVAFAHTPICDCFDNGDGTVTCEGGFSDGSSVAGLPLRLFDERGRLLIDGIMSEEGEFTFKIPDVDVYRIEFDAGEEHVVSILSDDIW